VQAVGAMTPVRYRGEDGTVIASAADLARGALGRARRGARRVAAFPSAAGPRGDALDEKQVRRRVEQARAGDPDALGALFEAYRPDLLRLCRRLLGPADAEDAVHDAFLRVEGSLDRFDASRPFRPWLLTLAARLALDRLRRRSTERRLFGADEAEPDALAGDTPSPLQGELDAALRRRVQGAVDALPDRYRAPIVLRYFAELPYESIAELLDVSANQVATLLFRGRKRLRASLAADHADDGPEDAS